MTYGNNPFQLNCWLPSKIRTVKVQRTLVKYKSCLASNSLLLQIYYYSVRKSTANAAIPYKDKIINIYSKSRFKT